jgi:hypothetical protein
MTAGVRVTINVVKGYESALLLGGFQKQALLG